MRESQLNAGIGWLQRQGLNLFAILDTENTQESIQGISTQRLEKFRTLLDRYPRLILVGHGGKKMWETLDRSELIGDDPVDQFSMQKVQYFVRTYLDAPEVHYLYPGYTAIPLQRLGSLAGWHHASPLGLGINKTYGLWFSYRAAFLVDQVLPVTKFQSTASPCKGCDDKPCISACPVTALCATAPPDLDLCLTQRLAENSACALKCDARLACPVGAEHRYHMEQLNYHYRHSLNTLRRYARK